MTTKKLQGPLSRAAVICNNSMGKPLSTLVPEWRQHAADTLHPVVENI